MKLRSKILIIAGSDSSGGAGIQADIKTATSLGIYAMTAITAINLEESERAVWNAVRAQKYVSHIQEIISNKPEAENIRKPRSNFKKDSKVINKDAKANDLLDQFEELIQQFDSYGAFRRLAAKRLGIPVMRVTIQEINEVTKQVHQAYQDFPSRLRKV